MSVVGPERDRFEIADQDMDMARRALELRKPLLGVACFHDYQCAEKNLL